MSVTISYKKFGLIPISTTWFNASSNLDSASLSMVHTFRQSTTKLSVHNAACIQQSVFSTSAIDLTQSEENIWDAFDPKSCRYEIRKIQKMADKLEDIKILENTDIDHYVKVANDYIKIKKYAKPLKQWLLEKCLKEGYGALMSIYYNGKLLGGNFYIKDHPERVRLLYSFNDRFSDKELQKLSGAFMRYLHWGAIKKYKAEGFHWYDMGGLTLDKNSSAYGITQFKMSFGGMLFEEFDYTFVRNHFIGKLFNLYEAVSYRRLRKG
jgi:lipid II:glycine glycyltransferase (peptidoglycan interpeptide bridge formation enzyme)